MQDQPSLPSTLQRSLNHGLLQRLPITFLPFVNQQLREWEFLFPRERQSVERLLLYVQSLSPEQTSALFREVVQLETRMDVRHWKFSTSEQTILNSSELARSPYFQEWRQAVQAVFDASIQQGADTDSLRQSANRLVLLNIPLPMVVDSIEPWKHWLGIGRRIPLDLSNRAEGQGAFASLVLGERGEKDNAYSGVLHASQKGAANVAADTWVIDAGSRLVDAILKQGLMKTAGGVLLSYDRLDRYRQSFSHEMNTMRKDLGDADAVFDRLRHVDVEPWCPPEVSENPAVREFVRSLFLTGNGAVIFGNSFAEWAASEAFRRARPAVLVAQFSVRQQPKPFTGVAVFDDPDQVNPLPSMEDLQGSTIDAQMLARYVWLAANRHEEYQRATACLCVVESLSEAYLVAPPEFPLGSTTKELRLKSLANAATEWIS